jgi:excisionase family DNA binding protein
MLGGGTTMTGRRGQSNNVDTRTVAAVAELVDIASVANRLGVTVRHVRRLVAERRIPYVKWGHLLRFDPDEIEAWIDAVRIPPAG